MKMPGIYAAYAVLLAVFGQTHSGIHIGLIFVNAGAVILLFLVVRDVFGSLTGALAGAIYGLLSLDDSVRGFTANAEHFVVPAALAGIWLLRRGMVSGRYRFFVGAGLLLGLAFMMKQHGAAFIIFGGIWLLAHELRCRPIRWRAFVTRAALFAGGVFFPFILTCVVLWRLGVFETFWFWTFDYARHYVSMLPLEAGLANLGYAVSGIVGSAIWLWVLAGLGLVGLFWDIGFRKNASFLITFLICSFAAVCPGLYFREHYFILLLPAAAILASVGIAFIYKIFSRRCSMLSAGAAATIAGLLAFGHAMYRNRVYFFTAEPSYICAQVYWPNPFNESLRIAEFIRLNCRKDGQIAVLGSEPQIYFYSGRRSATSYVYVYPLMEPQPYASEMQDEMIGQVERASPDFLIVEVIGFAWAAQETSVMTILDWVNRYSSEFYHIVGVVDMMSPERVVYRWGREAEDYEPQSSTRLVIMRHNRLREETIKEPKY